MLLGLRRHQVGSALPILGMQSWNTAPVKPPFLLLSLTMNFLSICYMPKDALGTWETEVDMSGRISSHEDNILVGGDRHQTDKMSGEVEG